MDITCSLSYAAHLQSGDAVSTYDTWDEAHNAAAADVLDPDPANIWCAAGFYDTFAKYSCSRSCITIDTSLVPANAIISLAVFRGTCMGGTTSILHLVEAVHGATAEASDFGALLSKVVSYGQVDFPGAPASFEMTLNAAGMAEIVKGGETKFGLRIDSDIDGVEPTGPNEFPITRSADFYIEYTLPTGKTEHPTHPEHPTFDNKAVPSAVMEEVLGVVPQAVRVRRARLILSTTPVAGQVFVDGTSAGVSAPGLDIEVQVSAGDHRISFGSVGGYTTPDQVSLFLAENDVQHITGSYVKVTGPTPPPPTPPPPAPPAPPTPGVAYLSVSSTGYPTTVQFYIDGVARGYTQIPTAPTSRQATAQVTPGTHLVSFEPVAGWNTPAPQAVTVPENQTVYVNGVYTREIVTPTASGLLRVNAREYSPTLPKGEYTWMTCVVYDSTGKSLGAFTGYARVDIPIIAGTYTVQPLPKQGFITPPNQVVSISRGLTTEITFFYNQ